MASVSPRSPLFCPLKTSNNGVPSSSPYKRPSPGNCTFRTLVKATSSSSSTSESEKPEDGTEKPKLDPVRIAFEKATAYKKSVQSKAISAPAIVKSPVLKSDDPGSKNNDSTSEFVGANSGISKESAVFSGDENELLVTEAKNGENKELSASLELAMEKAKEYKKTKTAPRIDKGAERSRLISGLEEDQNQNYSANSLSKEIYSKKEELTISSIDFVGLGFADKKQTRGLPPGLQPISEPFLDGDMPEVEILVGDTSKFGHDAESKPKLVEKNETEIYKPKVSTWGVFPRPGNISKTFGGGRVIHPGEQLETTEDKAAKQKRTRELLAAYKKRMGSSIDPRLKFECEKALGEGDTLMDLGKLKEALPFYKEIMDKVPFQNELHGLAALQWSICQDSLSRTVEARAMYEKLQSHPNVEVRKRAKQFLFGFQAMEMMKVKGTPVSAASTGYQNFFEAFIEEKSSYAPKEGDEVEEQGRGALGQAIPYIVFLVSPIFLVLLVAVRRGI